MRSKKKLQIFIVFFGIAYSLYAFVFNEFSETHKHSKPLKVGVDTSEILRFSSSHLGHLKMRYFTYLPNEMNDSMRVIFVMHGTDRNAYDYMHAWMKFADSNNYLIVSPEFTELIHGETFDYQEGNIWNQHQEWNQQEDWAFSTVERIFSELKLINALEADSFTIFGHSAGAQFVHRMVLFMPEARIDQAFAANAGWYTVPNDHENFPYGLKHTSLTDQSLAASFAKQLFLLLGEDDLKNDHLRQTENANQQGKTRIQRGKNFYKYSSEKANKIGAEFHWTKEIIKHAGHNYILMSKAAQKLLVKH